MNRYIKSGVAVSLALFTAGCDDFLQGPGLTENPNQATQGTAQQQLIAIQSSAFTRLEGQMARSAGIYTQQIIGSNNQQLQWATQYLQSESDIPAHMSAMYTGAGLVGIRNIIAYGEANSDPLMVGLAKAWEGYLFGNAASVWGDLPYSEAVNPAILTPKLDPQESLYQEVQKRFDEALAAFNAAPSTGNCETSDLIYCATVGPRATQIARWIRATNTLKARYHLHLAERNGNSAYQAALAAATNGINEAPQNATQAMHGQAPGDFRSFHGSTLDQDANIWASFLNSRQDLVAGHTLVQMLKDRNDPRLAAYFNPNGAGQFVGNNQNNVAVGTGGASVINTTVRRAFTFRQPLVTWAENELILAETKFRLQGAAAALPHVNNVRVAVGMAPLGSVTLNDVLTEKYIAMYQNIEVWNDWKRTCFPVLTPFGTAAEIPGRLPYSSAERTANPNIPLPSAYPAGTTGVAQLRNWNDPNACPRP
jgi:hypothetical protein